MIKIVILLLLIGAVFGYTTADTTGQCLSSQPLTVGITGGRLLP